MKKSSVVIPRRITVTFKESVPVHLINALSESDFLGLGIVYRGNDRTLHVKPDLESYGPLKEQLEMWGRRELLSFVEEFK